MKSDHYQDRWQKKQARLYRHCTSETRDTTMIVEEHYDEFRPLGDISSGISTGSPIKINLNRPPEIRWNRY